MNIVCSKNNIISKVNIVQKAVPSKSTMPLLEGILLSAKDKFKMTSNNYEIGIECTVEANIVNKGEIVVNSKIFGDILRKMPDSDIFIKIIENNHVLIESENSSFKIKGLSPEGFPDLAFQQSQDGKFFMKQSEFGDMVRKTAFAVANDETMPMFTGVLVRSFDEDVVMVAVDGFRLAMKKNPLEKCEKKLDTIIPARTLVEVAKISCTDSELIHIYSLGNKVFFEMDNCRIVSRILEGQFLKYDSVIPDSFDTKVIVNTDAFLASIERASLVSEDEKKHPVLVSVRDEVITVNCNTNIGNLNDEVSVQKYGRDVDIGFNPKYLIDALKSIDDENIEISFSSEIGPCVITPIENDRFKHMILPVRTIQQEN